MLRTGDEGLQGDAVLRVFVLGVLAVKQASGGRKGGSSVLWQLGMRSIRNGCSHFPSDFMSGVGGGELAAKSFYLRPCKPIGAVWLCSEPAKHSSVLVPFLLLFSIISSSL